MSQSSQPALVYSAVREQLEKILAHRLFCRSERMVRFLRFAVDHSLNGHAVDLKEYVIGVEVFDRKPDYDPRVDPIVRVEARRLRSKLKAYYDGDGLADPVRIEFPSGSYAPLFCDRRATAAPPPAEAPSVITVVVLPFGDLSLKPGNEYFSDGLTEELIHVLTKVAGLRVVAWTSAARLRDRQQDLAAIREQLGAAFVLTGSARIAGASLRVRAQLIDTATGAYQWSETFDRRLHDVFAIQEEIARAIVRTLRLQLSPAAGTLARTAGAINSYDHYLKGRYYWHRRTPADLERSVEYFRAAIELDPQSSLAHTGLADAWSLLVDYGLLNPEEGMQKARESAARAIALDPQSAEALCSLALIRGLYDWQWSESESLYLRAIELNPGYATAHHWLGVDCHAMLGRLDEAAAGLETALQLDPLSSIVREGRAFIHLLRRDYGAAEEAYRRLTISDPDFYKGYTGQGRAHALQGNYLDALRLLDQGRAMAGDIPNILAAMGQVYALGGEKERAREMLTRMEGMARTGYVPSTAFAIVHLGLGEHERALDWLEKGVAVHDPPLCSLNVHPVYDPLRGQPRFESLLRALNFR